MDTVDAAEQMKSDCKPWIHLLLVMPVSKDERPESGKPDLRWLPTRQIQNRRVALRVEPQGNYREKSVNAPKVG